MTSSSISTARPPAPAAKTSGSHTTAILVIILVSYFMILLDNSIIFTALPASGLVNTFHQLGMALGLSVLVSVSANSGHGLTPATALAAHVHTALTAGTVLLGACLLAVIGLTLPAHPDTRRPRQAARHCQDRAATAPASAMTSA